jgi:hypothetical protein
MKIKNKLTMTAAALVAGLVSLQQAGAATVSTNLGTLSGNVTTSGTFADQGDVFEAMFSLSSSSNLTLFTTSYAGGGFEPQITLYTSAGNFVASEAVTSPVATVDPSTGLAADAYLFDGAAAPGAYIAVVTDFLNQQPASATNLSDGFMNIGVGGNNFFDEQGNPRNANYSLNLSTASASSVPEPATLWLSVPILAFGLAQFCKRRS